MVVEELYAEPFVTDFGQPSFVLVTVAGGDVVVTVVIDNGDDGCASSEVVVAVVINNGDDSWASSEVVVLVSSQSFSYSVY